MLTVYGVSTTINNALWSCKYENKSMKKPNTTKNVARFAINSYFTGMKTLPLAKSSFCNAGYT